MDDHPAHRGREAELSRAPEEGARPEAGAAPGPGPGPGAAPGAPAADTADTIVAVATPPGRGGIGVVRVSGPRAGAIARAVTGRTPAPRAALRARFLAADGEALDDGIALWFPGPHSYTGEDTLELQGHGGPVVLDRVAGRVLALGARAARPGEFTERAFLNGKLDLVQAEAVADLIDAATEEAARLARRSLEGALSERVEAAAAELVRLRAEVEGALDFPDEEDVPAPDGGALARGLEAVREALAGARAAAARGNLLREGFAVVIVGRPNVGKSSLLNRMVGRERAIVTAMPGTTRDTLHEAVQIDGLPLRIVDTAGLRPTADPVERAGIERTWAAVGDADAVLAVVDDRRGLDDGDRAILERLPAHLPRVVVHNKIDLTGSPPGELPAEIAGGDGDGVRSRIALSARTGEGVECLRERLKALAGYAPGAEGLFMARRRHLAALDEALAALDDALRAVRAGRGAELAAEDLRLAQRTLGEITGEFTTEDLLGRIFSAFCIGK